MPANLINTSNQINANTAGQTRAAEDISPVSTQAGITATETGDNLFGSLGSILSGGVHPEAVPGVVDTSVQRATDSVRGKLGGLVPKSTSVTAPGPVGSANAAKATLAGASQGVTKTVSDARSTIANAIAKYRKK
jgi:hypothetical protein